MGEAFLTWPYLARSLSTIAVALICLASLAGGQNQRPPRDTTAKRADSTIQRMKAAQTALPIDPRERIADDSDGAAAKRVVGDVHQRGDGALWKALGRSANQAIRAQLIELIAPSGIRARSIAERLRTASDAGERAALIRALGEFTGSQLSQSEREGIIAILFRLYPNDPDAEVHSSIAWLLGSAESDSAHHRIDWKQMLSIEALDSALGKTPPRDRSWTESIMGHTMIAIRPATAFIMGAPLSEARRDTNELPHKVYIPRAFAIASKEVSVAQFQRFLSETGRSEAWLKATREKWPNNPDPEKFVSHPRRAQFAVTWYEAAQYCNWLSARAGIPKDQWVYPDSIGPGMKLPANYLHRTGYRLPTEAEWEFAARAGSASAHFFGDGVALLDHYAWYFVNANLHGWPVATKEPNQFGLFDMYGNAWEWVNDRWVDYKDRGAMSSDTEDTELVVTDDTPRVRRGGSWSYDKETTRSAHRGSPGGYRPPDRKDSVGFRVAQTLK
jgi:formylglycine-generating enzyme required for sulfatase activity